MAVGAVFDDVSTKFLGDTFNAVFAMLHGAQYPDQVREAIADRVLEFAKNTTERDAYRLLRTVVASLRIYASSRTGCNWRAAMRSRGRS